MRETRRFGLLISSVLAGLSSVVAAAWEVVAARPTPTVPAASPAWRAAAVGVLLLGALVVFWRVFRREAALERAPLTALGEVDAPWLERHVFSLTPELVGAAYDGRIAGSEVAAVLARMSAESKLASRVTTGSQGWNNLELWLLVERDELSGYERELIDRLFVAGKATSGDAVQREYRAVGFEPAQILRRHLHEASDAELGVRPPRAGRRGPRSRLPPRVCWCCSRRPASCSSR